MRPLKFTAGPLACLATLLTSVSLAHGGLIRLDVRDTVSVPGPLVQLKDVAKITASATDRLRLESLEVLSLDDPDAPDVVTHQTIRIRLALAGWDLRDIHVSGARQVEIRQREPKLLSDREVEEAAFETIRDFLHAEADELMVRLTSPLVQSLPDSVQKEDGLTVEVLPPSGPLTGQTMMTVRFLSDERILTTRPTRFEILRKYSVVVMRKSMDRSEEITDADVQQEIRFLDHPVDQLNVADVTGQHLRTPVNPGDVLTYRQLAPAVTNEATGIRRGDMVPAIMVAGRLRTMLRQAEAMQNGRVGDTIQMRNPDTKKLFPARVTADGIVEGRLR